PTPSTRGWPPRRGRGARPRVGGASGRWCAGPWRGQRGQTVRRRQADSRAIPGDDAGPSERIPPSRGKWQVPDTWARRRTGGREPRGVAYGDAYADDLARAWTDICSNRS